MTEADVGKALLAVRGYADGMGLPVPSQETLGTVSAILSSLPAGTVPPLLATDGEGCALLRWADAEGRGLMALTVDGKDVHATIAPGTASRHLPAFEWDGGWPSVLVDSLAGAGREPRDEIAGRLPPQ